MLESGNRIKELRSEAKCRQIDLAGERTVRAWEGGYRLPTKATRGRIYKFLSGRLKRDVSTEVETLVGRDLRSRAPSEPSPRKQLEAIESKKAVALVLGALDGWEAMGGTYRYPSFLGADEEGLLFLVEHHISIPAKSELRSSYAVVYVPCDRLDGKTMFFLGTHTGAHAGSISQPDSIPYVGQATEASFALRSGKEVRCQAFVIQVCRERSAPAVPVLLSSAIAARDVVRPASGMLQKDFSNWLDLAISLTVAIWCMHSHRKAHGSICAENVMLRNDRGFFRDVTLIDKSLGNSFSADADRKNAWLDDLFYLGELLIGVLLGRREKLPETGDLPASWLSDELDKLYEKVNGELPRRAFNVCRRYLLEARMAEPVTEATPPSTRGEASVSVLPSDVPVYRWSVGQLQLFLNEVGALKAMHRRRLLLPRRIGLRPKGSRKQTRRDGAVSGILMGLLGLTDENERRAWCDTYVTKGFVSYSEEDPEQRLREAVAALKSGHGRTAAALLREVLKGAHAALSDDSIIKGLRLFAGLLAIRDGDAKTAQEVLDVYTSHRSSRVKWWVRLLRQKVEAEGAEPKPFVLDRYEHKNEYDRVRAEAWRVAHKCLISLKRGKMTEEPLIEEVERLLHGHAAHEATFGGLLLARAAIRRGNVEGFWRAIRAVSLSASYAATKKFPHDLAAALVIAAHVVREAAERLGDELAEQGIDLDECLVLAAECSLQAAELYQALDARARSYYAYRSAARCLFKCRSPSLFADGFKWLSLARNHRLLPWRPPEAEERASVEQDYGPTSPEPSSSISEQEELELEVAGWRARCAVDSAPDASIHDPGVVLADNYYDLYGSGIEWAFGTGAVSVELIRSTAGEKTVATGAVVKELIERATEMLGRQRGAPLRILDLGCGTGGDAVRLALDGHSVAAVDSSAWHIARARTRWLESGATGPSPRFFQVDPTRLGETRVDLGGPFDIILLRDSLAHVADKLRVLRAAKARLDLQGLLVGAEWVQKLTGTRTAWQRLFDTVWLATLESEQGLPDLLKTAGFVPFIELRHHDMYHFFRERHMWVSARANGATGSSEERTVMKRAETDLRALTRLADPGDGLLGWVFFWARPGVEYPAASSGRSAKLGGEEQTGSTGGPQATRRSGTAAATGSVPSGANRKRTSAVRGDVAIGGPGSSGGSKRQQAHDKRQR